MIRIDFCPERSPPGLDPIAGLESKDQSRRLITCQAPDG